MEQKSEFVKRVLQKVPGPQEIKDYFFQSWSVAGKTTSEGVGILAVPGAEPQLVVDRIMDVDSYKGNIGYVEECRAVADNAYVPPDKVRFYQRISIPMLGAVHHELVLQREGSLEGYEVVSWFMLEQETSALPTKKVVRSQYNDGAWLLAPGIIGYALSSAPRREDVGFLKWKAMTSGADAAASKVIRSNIENMAIWAKKS